MTNKALVLIIIGLLVIGVPINSVSAQEGSSFMPSYLKDLLGFLERAEEKEEQEQEEEVEDEVFHQVEKGETLTSIANEYDVEISTLVSLNNLVNPDRLSIGQELMIKLPQELDYTIKRGDTISALALAYGTEVEDIIAANDIENVRALAINDEIIIPNPTKIPPPPEARVVTVASRGTSTASRSSTGAPNFIWPLQGTITSHFGAPRGSSKHLGLDIAAPKGTAIRAAASGEVVSAKRGTAYGLYVVLDHGGGWQTLYAHASKLLVKAGQQVAQGEKIALVGRTGNTTGNHLHLEVKDDGTRINPLNCLP